MPSYLNLERYDELIDRLTTYRNAIGEAYESIEEVLREYENRFDSALDASPELQIAHDRLMHSRREHRALLKAAEELLCQLLKEREEQYVLTPPEACWGESSCD